MIKTETETVDIAGTKMLRHSVVIIPNSRETFDINGKLVAIETYDGAAKLVWAEPDK